jgi:AraC-like DNA-binding protein/PAS domain-containing protein
MVQPGDPDPGLESGRPLVRSTRGPTELLSGHLLAGARWDDRLEAALEALGHLARADRVLLVSREKGRAGSVVRAWPSSVGGAVSAETALRFDDEALASWLGTLAEGRPIRIEAGDAPLVDQVLDREGAVGILALPIVTVSGWWGYVRIERVAGLGWGDAEVDRLLDASRLLGWGVERWAAEVQLRDELEGHRTTIEEAPGLAYIHSDGEPKRILTMSPRIEEVLGYPVEAWLRDPGFAWGLLHPDDRIKIEALDALGAPPVLEYRMFARDGRLVWLCDATARGHDSQGRVIHRGVLVDITSLREPDEAISEASARDKSKAGPRIATAMQDDPEPQPVAPHIVRLAEDASRYMREHLAESVDLSSLSGVLAVSPDHLGRVFKRYMGTTPHQFLIDLRLEAAEGLLAESDLTVTQIAWRVGFASPSHFVTTFRARTGTTPLKFRRRVR